MLRPSSLAASLLVIALATACSSSSGGSMTSSAGTGSGGVALGGGSASTAGAAGRSAGGMSTGGAGGTSAGGTSAGGTSAGGTSAGDTSMGGASGTSAGGTSASGAGMAGASTGGAGMAGASTAGAGGTMATVPPLFSDDFEAAAIDTTKWTNRINGNGTITLDTSQKHGGKQSLHVTQNGFSTMLAAEGAPVFPAPNNEFYARVWVRVAAATGGNAAGLPTGHVSWIESGDVTNDTHEVRVGANLGYFQSNLYPPDIDIRDPMANMTADVWHCIQIHYGNDLLDVSLDGVHSSISTTNWVASDSVNGNTTAQTGWAPTYAAFRIGYELGGPADIWYDDVALGYSAIACN